MPPLTDFLPTVWAGAPAWIANAGTAVFWYVAIVRLRLLPAWPLDGGASLAGNRLLGDSRTVFGSFFMLACASAVGWLQGDASLGLFLGSCALIGTLVDSFVKRRLGMPEGRRFFLDHVDYALAVVAGVWLTGTAMPGWSPLLFVLWVLGFQLAVNALAGLFGVRSAVVHARRKG